MSNVIATLENGLKFLNELDVKDDVKQDNMDGFNDDVNVLQRENQRLRLMVNDIMACNDNNRFLDDKYLFVFESNKWEYSYINAFDLKTRNNINISKLYNHRKSMFTVNKYNSMIYCKNNTKYINDLIGNSYGNIMHNNNNELHMIFRIGGVNGTTMDGNNDNICLILETGDVIKIPKLNTPRFKHSIVYSKQSGLYVFGGYDKNCKPQGSIEHLKIYDKNTHFLQKKDDNKQDIPDLNSFYSPNMYSNTHLYWDTIGKSEFPRRDHTSVLYNNIGYNNSDEFILTCMGTNKNWTKDCEIFNISQNKFIPIREIQNVSKYAGSTYWKNYNKCVIIGGVNNYGKNNYMYDVIKNKWINLPDTNDSHKYYPCINIEYSNKYIKSNNGIIICMGNNGQYRKDWGNIEFLDVRDNKNKWISVQNNIQKMLNFNDNDLKNRKYSKILSLNAT